MKRLIREQKANLGGYLFDGTILFLWQKLHNDITEFMTKDREENPIQITVKFVKLISMLNGESIQVLNLILRNSLAALDLQLVGRNFFDAIAKVISGFSIETTALTAKDTNRNIVQFYTSD